MAEYIERETLKKALCPYSDDNYSQDMETILNIVDEQPAVDVEPVRHGRWVKYAGKLICSECKKYPPMKDESGGWRTYHEWPYCPNCGTKMDEEVGT